MRCFSILTILSIVLATIAREARFDDELETSWSEKGIVLLQAFAEVIPRKGNNSNGKRAAHSSFLVGALQKPSGTKVKPVPAQLLVGALQKPGGTKVKPVLAQQAAPTSANSTLGEAASSVSRAPRAVARTAPLTEEGYLSIVALHSNEQMRCFVRRVLAANGLGVSQSMEGALSGFVPFYSGQKATQSLQNMQRELQNTPWVVRIPAFVAEALMDGASGASAPLTEVGYQVVAAMRSDAEMALFIRRVLEGAGGAGSEAQIKRVLADLAPIYSGSAGPEQSLAQLKRELLFFAPSEDAALIANH